MLVGATGLVGARVLELMLGDSVYGEVHVLVRRATGSTHQKLREHLVDFDAFELAEVPHVDDVFCCLGTTIKAAGSQDAFRRVDFDYVFKVARLAREQGARQFLLVTAMGASAKSSVFYNRVKGEIEAAVRGLDFDSVSIFRPSFINGKRREKRPMERVSVEVLKRLARLMPAKYRPLDDVKIARAMLHSAKCAAPGIHIVESDVMQSC